VSRGQSPVAAPPAPSPNGWRRRHPVVARLLLYSAFLAVGGLGVGLLLARRGLDREDRLRYLASRLDGLGLVYLQNPDGREALRVLDAEFSDPALPPNLRQRALRLRAVIHAHGGRKDEAERTFREADGIAVGPRDRGALLVEWAEARSQTGDPAGAISLLDRPDAIRDGALGILGAMSRAFAEESRGAREAGANGLEAVLEALPRPLPAGPEDFVATRPWTPAQAATDATALLVRMGGKVPGAWSRLKSLAPKDFGAQAAAARGLEEAGQHAEAEEAWKAACACDPDEAKGRAAKDRTLGGLETGRGEGLKAP
jgi:tetratricopeptide (TPR) repeat protein